MRMDRRRFIKNTGIAALGVPCLGWAKNLEFIGRRDALEVHLFSKHLQFLSLEEASEVAAGLGFSGLDLTVRPNGHILPERAKYDLPQAIETINNAGIKCELITTAIAGVQKQEDRDLIRWAAEGGVKFYRMNWLNYFPNKSMQHTLDQYQEQVKTLSFYNKKHNIIGCYQNHAGTKVGSSFWEIKHLLEKVDPDFLGAQYDIRHAVVEGGKSWPNGLRLLKDHIKTIAIKDFKWESRGGKARLVNVPLGEGMVDFKRYFKHLKKGQLKPPVSLHLEYPLGGAEKGKTSLTIDKQIVFDAMRRDLNRLHQLWDEA